jgi:hypothetical protein
VHGVTGQRIQVGRQGRDQGLALPRAHLGDLALVQGDTADQLHVEVPHAHDATTRLADHGKGLGENRIELLAVLDALAELIGARGEVGVAERLQVFLQCVDALDDPCAYA